MLILSKDRFWWSEKKPFILATTRIIRTLLRCKLLYSHNYIPDMEPAPYGSSFTEQQVEECQEEEEERTMVENVNFEASPSNQVNLSMQVIRNKNGFEIK